MPVVTHDDEDDPFPIEGEEAPAVRVRDVFSGIFHHHHDYNQEYSQGYVPRQLTIDIIITIHVTICGISLTKGRMICGSLQCPRLHLFFDGNGLDIAVLQSFK